MTIVMIVRFVVENMVDAAATGNPCGKLLACCVKCCIRCIEDVLEYLTKTAYSFMAITGQPFCKAGWNGFLLNLKHCAKFYFALMLARGFVTVGTIIVTILNVLIGWVMVTHISKES